MANEEHLAILQQGAKRWNEWLMNHVHVTPDLSGADLSELDLTGVYLSGANFGEANLRWTKLNYANLTKANFNSAYLSGAYLNMATLNGADFSGAYLDRSELKGASINGAILQGALLSNTNCTGANCTGADLTGAGLCDSILINTNFIRSDMSRVDLSKTNLQNANLQRACLINAKLDGANLTDSSLWETQRASWSIKGIICESAYWDRERKEKIEYTPGEFEKLFKEKPIFKLFYKEGIQPLEIATLPSLIKRLEEQQDHVLPFVKISEDAGGAVIELAIENISDLSENGIKKVQEELTIKGQQLVEFQQETLSNRVDFLRLESKYEQLTSDFDKLLLRQGNTFNNYGQAGAMGDNSQAHDSSLNQIVNEENSSVGTQVQGERNIAIADASDSSISTGDKSND